MPVISKNETLELLIKEIEKIDGAEQKILLRQLKLKVWLRAAHQPVVTYKHGAKPMTKSQIDAVKHKARAIYADK
jgi:hypothetical protein